MNRFSPKQTLSKFKTAVRETVDFITTTFLKSGATRAGLRPIQTLRGAAVFVLMVISTVAVGISSVAQSGDDASLLKLLGKAETKTREQLRQEKATCRENARAAISAAKALPAANIDRQAQIEDAEKDLADCSRNEAAERLDDRKLTGLRSGQ